MKKVLLVIGVTVANLLFAQNISSKKWRDLFSYNNVLAFQDDDGKVVAATENGIFFYNYSSGEITKLSKANGLHDVKITAFDYNPETNIGLVGYATGSMDVFNDSGVLLSVDIPIATGFTGDKNINHISITGNQAVISADYGVSVFNLARKEFGLSCYFITGGIYQPVNEAAIKDGKVFAATSNGLMSHLIDVTFPVYSTWTTEMAGNFTEADCYNSILTCGTANNVYLHNGTSFNAVSTAFTSIKDIVVSNQNIVVTDDTRIYVLNSSGSVVNNVTFGESCNTAGYVNGALFGGTILSGLKDTAGNKYKPDGPYSNISYKIHLKDNQIWVASGGMASYNTPVVRDLGYYHFTGSQWVYPDYFIDNPIDFNVMDVIPNPSNINEVFFTNYTFTGDKGMFKMENNAFVKFYNTDTSLYNRPVGMEYDENNNLFVTAFLLDSTTSLAFGYYLYDRNSDSFSRVPVITGNGAGRPTLKDGYFLSPCPWGGGGGIVVKYYGNSPSQPSSLTKIINSQNNLPIDGTVSFAVDKNDDFWIGSKLGLRVLSDGFDAITEASPQTEEIIIERNGIAEELFRDSNILAIAVDSGNQKWISVDGGGVYYLSPNGEQVYKHFTSENSPLPDNSITDIQVDEKTGLVYFVGLTGIVTYQGDVVGVNSNFGNVLVYPNPVVYSNFKGNVTIRGLAEKTNIRITDAAGNLVHQAVARGGFYEWNLNNQKGKRVASGVYFVLLTNEDGSDSATAKIAVVN